MSQLLPILIYAALESLAGHTALAVFQAPPHTNQSWALPTFLAHLKRLASSNITTTVISSKARASDMCQGYYDVMGQYDAAFNCTTGGYRFCCGTCHYRFCCEDRSRRLEQAKCPESPPWITTPATGTSTKGPEAPNGSKQTGNSTVYVICGVISFTLAVGVGLKFFFSKASRRPHGRELNVPRALVDILRHQAGSSSCSERNNSLVINSNFQDNGSARPPKNLYSTVKPSKSSHDNMHHNYMHLNASSPKHHTATLDWHMNHTPSHSSGKYNTLSCSRSFHNLSHLPPSYETAIKSELNRYSSLKRLAEKDLDEFYVKRRHLAELTRGTLPLHAMKMNYDRDGYSEKSHNPRRVMSQEHILSDGGGGGESYRPSHYDYTIPRDRVISHERLLSRENLHSQERLLSPERLHQGTGPFQDVHQGHQKALSQTNVCATSTPMLDHHHMMQMNSHPPANNSPKTTAPWEGSSNQGGAASRRQGFAAKRQSTIEQLQYIPGHHPGQHIHTGSKNEVTV